MVYDYFMRFFAGGAVAVSRRNTWASGVPGATSLTFVMGQTPHQSRFACQLPLEGKPQDRVSHAFPLRGSHRIMFRMHSPRGEATGSRFACQLPLGGKPQDHFSHAFPSRGRWIFDGIVCNSIKKTDEVLYFMLNDVALSGVPGA